MTPYFGNTDGISDFFHGSVFEQGPFVTCRTKGAHSNEFQNLLVTAKQTGKYWEKFGDHVEKVGRILGIEQVPLWIVVTHQVSESWEWPQRCSIAMDSKDLVNDISIARQVIKDDMHILVPYQYNYMNDILAYGRSKKSKNGVIVKVCDEIVYAHATSDVDYAKVVQAKALDFKKRVSS